MALAHGLGKTLEELGEMDLDELALWAAWYQEHDPALFDDLRAGTLAATLVNVQPGRRRRYKPGDFFPRLRQLGRVKPEDSQAAMLAWVVNAGGQVRTETR